METGKEKWIFLDTEAEPDSGRVLDFGAVRGDGKMLHTASPRAFSAFLKDAGYLAGHNILEFDLRYIQDLVHEACPEARVIDTLCLSPLLFPARPYHRLLKDDKLQSDELNNPLNDALKCRELFDDEAEAFRSLPGAVQKIYQTLLEREPAFSGFFAWMKENGTPEDAEPGEDPETEKQRCIQRIRNAFSGKICGHADLESLIRHAPAELAYTLALVGAGDRYSITPPWLARRYPGTGPVMRRLRGTPCGQKDCLYCGARMDPAGRLKDYFGYDSFRTYEGEPLQEQAVRAAIAGESLLAVFPTGGGKSVTFQLPALIAGETVRGLTVVISPLQSLMKDQVDHLEERGIADAVTINGLLNPLERKAAIDRIANGFASILYISPESLRSATVENLLISRNVVRFVIDEAHCFSAWGQDFRVDYLYIGDFIRKLQENKRLRSRIPVSCFTATAKKQVIGDIQDYFRRKLGLELKLFTTAAERQNLRYAVLPENNDEEKYTALRNLISGRSCPAIVYVSRVRRTRELAERLRADGFTAEAYNGKMDSQEKIRVQNAFLRDEIQVIVATSAFGMGVDKKDVGLVVHYEISDSLESYTQEAGRAGRDENMQAECYVLFNEEDLDKHFVLLNQTRLSLSEIQQVWRAVKEQTGRRMRMNRSALEIARQAGWDDSVSDIETRVTTAVAALENAGYVERGRNVPHIYANSIQVPSVMAAAERLAASGRMTEEEKQIARRVLGFLISRKTTWRSTSETAESRVDYLADRLGLPGETVVRSILQMREEGLLADQQDLIAVLRRTDTENRSLQTLRQFLDAERFLLEHFEDHEPVDYRGLNDLALRSGVAGCTVKNLKTLVLCWQISGMLQKEIPAAGENTVYFRKLSVTEQRVRLDRRSAVCDFALRYLFSRRENLLKQEGEDLAVSFSVMELEKAFNTNRDGDFSRFATDGEEVQQALLYLHRIGALRLEGGFLVSYNTMQILRKETNNHIQYKNEDYRQLKEYYQQRMQQIHIVGEYAHLMAREDEAAESFVRDYFQMDSRKFLDKYFPEEERKLEISRNMTPERFERLFGNLSDMQRAIIQDRDSERILVLAGPGSGKTRILVHKLASLLMMEEVKHEQLLMLTFSRAAATEFKARLLQLVGNAAHFVEIKTFHSYCFDLVGRIGNLRDTDHVVEDAVRMILQGQTETAKITKTVLVIDEAQDMDEKEYALVQALARTNEHMRIIAVGDDDQNIYEFRGSSSVYMKKLLNGESVRQYEMTENYRSDRRIVDFCNAFSETIGGRMKTVPIRSVSGGEGVVRLIRYAGSHLETPLAEAVREKREKEGSLCVLTATNDEAARVTGLLNRCGCPASLIQSDDGFDLYNLAEIRFFLHAAGTKGTVIREEDWQAAREKLAADYADSAALPFSLNMIDTFAGLNRIRYRSDLETFLHESKPEDFAESGKTSVVVSTMHKAKGKEYDSVYLMLDGYDLSPNAARRAVYVAMTRARHELQIHTNGGFFDRFRAAASEYIRNRARFSEPEELLLPLTHRDVYLDFYLGRGREIGKLRSGERLIWREGSLYPEKNPARAAVRLSAACMEKLKQLEQKGYQVCESRIRYVVAWQPAGDKPETMIVLPDLLLRRQQETGNGSLSIDAMGPE